MYTEKFANLRTIKNGNLSKKQLKGNVGGIKKALSKPSEFELWKISR